MIEGEIHVGDRLIWERPDTGESLKVSVKRLRRSYKPGEQIVVLVGRGLLKDGEGFRESRIRAECTRAEGAKEAGGR